MKNLYLILCLIFALPVISQNKLECTASQKNSMLGKWQICSWKSMNLLNQKKVSRVHCAPTAVMMGLSALVEGKVDYLENSWISNNYVGKSDKERIKLTGELLGTDDGGTSSASTRAKYIDLATNFPKAIGKAHLPYKNLLNNEFLKTRIDDRFVDVMGYGHYKQECEKIVDFKLCSFKRNGGHAVAINGYKFRKNKLKIITYDPWGGNVKNRSIKEVDNKSNVTDDNGVLVDLRPFQEKTLKLYSYFNYYKIIDYIVGIQTN